MLSQEYLIYTDSKMLSSRKKLLTNITGIWTDSCTYINMQLPICITWDSMSQKVTMYITFTTLTMLGPIMMLITLRNTVKGTLIPTMVMVITDMICHIMGLKIKVITFTMTYIIHGRLGTLTWSKPFLTILLCISPLLIQSTNKSKDLLQESQSSLLVSLKDQDLQLDHKKNPRYKKDAQLAHLNLNVEFLQRSRGNKMKNDVQSHLKDRENHRLRDQPLLQEGLLHQRGGLFHLRGDLHHLRGDLFRLRGDHKVQEEDKLQQERDLQLVKVLKEKAPQLEKDRHADGRLLGRVRKEKDPHAKGQEQGKVPQERAVQDVVDPQERALQVKVGHQGKALQVGVLVLEKGRQAKAGRQGKVPQVEADHQGRALQVRAGHQGKALRVRVLALGKEPQEEGGLQETLLN